MKATGMGGDGDNVENSSGGGMGMGMTGVGTVGDEDKYVSPCSSLIGLSPGVQKDLTKFCR